MKHLLTIENLSVSFDTDEGVVPAVQGVSLAVGRGEALGLVGESGCGKSVTALSVLRLIPHPPGRIESGRILFNGRDLLALPMRELRGIRGQGISTIFQEPMTALSPLHRIGAQMAEALRFHRRVGRREAWREAVRWLGKVGIPDPDEKAHAYPHQLSGGMRQRVMIATALMLDPELIIADEPTTALDVTIQAQVFDLIREMKKQDTALLLITHDMAVVSEMCTRLAVMYASEIVEVGPLRSTLEHPLHPYTEALLASVPSLAGKGTRLRAIPGQVPSPLAYPSGCRFRDRCPYAFDRCAREHPSLTVVDGRQGRCFLAGARATATEEQKASMKSTPRHERALP
jgi:peptide/nickel transport system ATP-binding protein/oligopeptide transport system ATP-binding protein